MGLIGPWNIDVCPTCGAQRTGAGWLCMNGHLSERYVTVEVVASSQLAGAVEPITTYVEAMEDRLAGEHIDGGLLLGLRQEYDAAIRKLGAR